MAQGIGLTDENRLPWLLSLRKLLLNWHNKDKNGVLACSALKDCYRHLLNSRLIYLQDDKHLDEEDMLETSPIDLNILYVLLNSEPALLEQRLAKRKDHPVVNDNRILTSQFQTLEIPSGRYCANLTIDTPGYLSVEKTDVNASSYYFVNMYPLTEKVSIQEIVTAVKKIIIWINENDILS